MTQVQKKIQVSKHREEMIFKIVVKNSTLKRHETEVNAEFENPKTILRSAP